MDYLATYGTLMRDDGRHRDLGVAEGLDFVDTCRIPGVLFDFGRFPGAVPPEEWTGEGEAGASAAIHGELFRLTTPGVLDAIDRYEGYDPDREAASLFVRRRVALLAPAETSAWVYWYNGDVAAGTRVPSGDWRDTRA